MAACPGAGDIGSRSITADVIESCLRVVLDGHQAGIFPETAAADGFDDLAEREVVVRDFGGRRGTSGTRSHGVIARQHHDDEIRHFTFALEIVQFGYETLSAQYVGNGEIESGDIRTEIIAERFNARLARDERFAGVFLEIAVIVQEVRFALLFWIFPAALVEAKLAIHAQRLAM